MKREWVNAGAGVVAAIAAVGILVVGMVTLAAGFAADVQASIDVVRADIRASMDAVRVDIRASSAAAHADIRASSAAAHAEIRASIAAAHAEIRASIEAAQVEIRASIEAAQVENRAAHAELDRKIGNLGENLGERIDRLYELLLAQTNR